MTSSLQNTEASEVTPEAVVYVVDDDTTVHRYVAWALQPLGCTVDAYGNAEDFLARLSLSDQPRCLITDLCMPGLSGLDLQAQLASRGIDLPIIMVSGQGEIRSAVTAIREGAIDFLEKPVDPVTLRTRVASALLASRDAIRHSAARAEVAEKLARLSPRQRLVLQGLMEGKPSKIIASELGLSPKTVDVHRFRLMRTLGAQSVPDLFRLIKLARGDSGSA